MLVTHSFFFALAAAESIKPGSTTEDKSGDKVVRQSQWTNNVVPVALAPSVDGIELELATDAAAAVEDKTCIHFVKANDTVKDRLTIKDTEGKCDIDEKTHTIAAGYKRHQCGFRDLVYLLARAVGLDQVDDNDFPQLLHVDQDMPRVIGSAINKAYGCDDNRYNPAKPRPKCLEAEENHDDKGQVDTEHSTYSFTLDERAVVDAGDKSWIGIQQMCHPYAMRVTKEDITENWGFTKFARSEWSPTKGYSITMPRCEKEHTRAVTYYNSFFCDAENKDACRHICVQRNVCNLLKKLKGANVTDTRPWICRPLLK